MWVLVLKQPHSFRKLRLIHFPTNQSWKETFKTPKPSKYGTTGDSFSPSISSLHHLLLVLESCQQLEQTSLSTAITSSPSGRIPRCFQASGKTQGLIYQRFTCVKTCANLLAWKTRFMCPTHGEQQMRRINGVIKTRGKSNTRDAMATIALWITFSDHLSSRNYFFLLLI